MKYFLFDKAQKYVTRINTEYLIEAHYTEEINTAGQLEFTLPATMRLPENVFYVCVTDPDDERSYLMFKIVTEKVTDEKVTYTCIENAYDELASYTYIKDKRPTAIASAMLQMVLDGTRWSVGTCPEVSPKFSSFYYISVLEAIQKIVNLWGFEVQFQVKIDGITNEIKQRNINLYTKLGKRTNKRFEYGSNLLSVTQANDGTGLYTALVGRGKGVQVSSGDTDTDPDGYGRRITFADVVWSTQSGNPLNKPKGQEYLEDPNATAAYGFPDGHPRIGFVTFQDCEDPNELIQLTYDKLQEVNHPQVQFSASIADVGSLDLGDTIAIVRHDIGIEYYTRVFKVVHDLLDSSNNTVELGDNIAGSNSITQQISNIQNNQSNVQNAIDTIVMSGSDGNKLFFGTDFPANGTDGDIFYKTLENGGTEMYIYKDGGWQLVVSTEELDTVQKKVDEQTSQIQQAVQDANAASAKADGLVAQVGDANTNAQKALTTAKQNQADLMQAKNQLSSAISDISQTKQRLSDLATQAQTQGQTIVNIQKTQSGLTADIADVKGNVSSLQDTANSLQSSIADNKNNIASIKQTVNGLESTVQGNSGQISQLKQTSTSMTSTIASLQSRGDNMFINPKFDGKSPWQCGSSVSITDDSYIGGKVVDLKKGSGSNYLAQANFGLQPEHWYKVEIFAKGTNGNEKLHIEFRGGKYQRDFTVTTDWQLYTLSGKVAKIEDPNLIKIYIWNNTNTDIKVAMPSCTPWGMDYDESTTIASKISQMSDDINLRVQKGDLLSQINIQAGKTLIQSDKLYLDASSVVFSGSAFIPSAAITDLSADKITTGTLNAANVHIINMDVANLVGDTESFVRSQWQSAYGAYVNIDSGGMSVGYGNFKTSFNTNGMQFISGGEKLGGFSTVGMEGQPSTYQGLMCSVGGDAEFFAIGAQDYHNTGQNPVPSKLVWMRNDVDKNGYMPGWNFGDKVWTDQIGINSINYGKWNIKFGIVSGSNGFTALTLTSGTGDGFYWGSDGSFGYVTRGNTLYSLRGTQIVNSINSDGTCQSWTTI